jgi:hypothetical protein
MKRRRGKLPAAAARRHILAAGEASLPPEDLDRRRQNALRLAEASEVLSQESLVGRRTGRQDEGLELFEVAQEGILRNEMVLTHRVDLLDGVVEVVRDRSRPRAPKLRGHPGLDLVRREVGRIVEEEIDRVGDHQRREAVGQVALELEERLPDVGIERLLVVFPRQVGKLPPRPMPRRHGVLLHQRNPC